jgi:methyl-CpG-binding domain protein 4
MPVTTRQAAKRIQQSTKVQHKDNATIKSKDIKERKRRFGLVQEVYQYNLYHLIVQAILWNQTHGNKAIIVLRRLLEIYPDPQTLALANEEQLTTLLQPIGLHRLRAKRLIALAQMWLQHPPSPNILHKVRHKCADREESRFEIAHLPGVGKYAIDSYRIFHRDQLRELSTSWDDRLSATLSSSQILKQEAGIEPEWKRVLPTDKDLKAFLIWAWSQDGYHWDPITGKVTLL